MVLQHKFLKEQKIMPKEKITFTPHDGKCIVCRKDSGKLVLCDECYEQAKKKVKNKINK